MNSIPSLSIAAALALTLVGDGSGQALQPVLAPGGAAAQNPARTTVAAPLRGRRLNLTSTPPLTATAQTSQNGGSAHTAADARWLFNQQTGWNAAVQSSPSVASMGNNRQATPGQVTSSSSSVVGGGANGGTGCATGVASPAIGANVPATYFGNPTPGSNPSFPGSVQLLTSGTVDEVNLTVTIPLYEGSMAGTGTEVWYIATDTSDEGNAMALGLNHSAKLTFGEIGRGARTGSLGFGGELVFDQGTVDFSPRRDVIAGPPSQPFPPTVARPGSIGDSLYSPLCKILNAGGHIYNLPMLAMGPAANLLDANGDPDYDYVHDSVLAIDFANETVTLALASGFSFGRAVLYISTDSNSPIAAALEGSTLAPGLDDIPVGNDDSLFSAVERIFITTNGAEGCDNPQRQGLFAAVSDGASPFNVLGGIPTIAPDYSPLWDANFGEWTQDSISSGYRSRLIDEFQILSFVENGFMTGPGGSRYGSSGIIINCPIVQRLL